MLKIENLSFYYENNHILKNISFKAKAGELWGLMGPNGSGKTTFLKCIMALLKPASCNIFINGENYHSITTAKMAKLIAYVPQEHKPPFPFSVKEIVLMGRSPHMGGIFGLKKADYGSAYEAMELLGILDIAERPVTSLSGGQRQLTLIARSLAQNAPIMILDEPTSALDFHNQISIWRILKKVSNLGKLVIACSHDPNHLLWFANRTLVLKNGEIIASGETQSIITPQILKEVYNSEYSISKVNDKNVIQPVF
ncbi:ABC transporter ATP-binding protein [Helicobacter turcicus]|uniref:ABC transporter ATP-binding protein n=1 Tax=Helicobacter turcicus TaxID=2867412 RepID=A0ABS7JLP8_9HELI|nr:ABC transporter ATP-binding protein [Helicobacter turcicus]MBX7490301.1 ABC transporter ATP-binding protein [Helicobacter turcicus]MBX7545120.1 ABC transporter ATP-binding protein [Helicobacter turcicus]